MRLDSRQQKDLFREANPSECRLPEVERQRIKTLLGELIVSVFEAEDQGMGIQEVRDDQDHL